MSSKVPPVRPERTTIAGSLEMPRMLNGLWQPLAGGHDDQHVVDMANASDAMDAL